MPCIIWHIKHKEKYREQLSVISFTPSTSGSEKSLPEMVHRKCALLFNAQAPVRAEAVSGRQCNA